MKTPNITCKWSVIKVNIIEYENSKGHEKYNISYKKRIIKEQLQIYSRT